MVWPEKTSGTLRQRDQTFSPGKFNILVTGIGLNIGDLQRLFAPDDDANQTFLDSKAGFFDIGIARAIAGTQIQPLTGVIEQHERAHSRTHEFAGFAGDDAQSFVQIQCGIDGAADAGQGLEEHHLQAQLFVEPGIVNDLGRLQGEFLQQFLVVR